MFSAARYCAVSLCGLLSACQSTPDAAPTGDAAWSQVVERYARAARLDPHGVALIVGRNCGAYADRSYMTYSQVHPCALGLRPTRATILAGYLVVFYPEADLLASPDVVFPAIDSLARAHHIRLEQEVTRFSNPLVWRIDDGADALRVYPDYKYGDPELRNPCL